MELGLSKTCVDGQCPQWRVTLLIDGQCVTRAYSYHNLHKTLFFSGVMARSVPNAECYIRRCRDNQLMGWLHTNHHGEVDQAEVSVQRGRDARYIVVTPLNPLGPIFRPNVA